MDTPQGTFTIAEAAEIWINAINASDTKGTPEEKSALIAKIRSASPKAKFVGVGFPEGTTEGRAIFTACTNAIGKVIREGNSK